MAKKKGIDPRFDPRFQRGFDGTGAPLDMTPPAPAASVDKAAPDAVAAEQQPSPPAAAPEPMTSGVPDELEPLRRFNPFRLALLLTSIGALVFAVWLMWQGVDSLLLAYGGGTDPWMQFVAQLDYSLPTPLLTGGLLGLVLWLAIGIVAPRRHREHE